MAPDGSGNIRVFVRWHDQTVFAGEEVKCTITFKNVAASPGSQQPKLPPTSQTDRSRLASPLHNRARAHAGLTPHPPPSSIGRGHRRSALSMNVPPTSSRSRSGSVQWPQPSAGSDGRSGHSHKRSVSIVSIGSASTVEDYHQRNDHQRNDSVVSSRPQRPFRGHSRASSLQIVPRAQIPAGPHSGMSSPMQLAALSLSVLTRI